MAVHKRGRHRSTDKDGKRTIALLEKIPGVDAVIICRSMGGKCIGRKRGVGDFKLQSRVQGGFKGVLQTSRGIQEIFILAKGEKDEIEKAIRTKFPD